MGDWPNFGRGFSVVHLNARSIRNKKAGLRQELGNKLIDVLLFSETFLNQLDDDFDYLLPNYNLYRHDRVSVHRGGGLIGHVTDSLTCSSEMFRFLNRGTIDIEVQWLFVQKGK